MFPWLLAQAHGSLWRKLGSLLELLGVDRADGEGFADSVITGPFRLGL